MNDSQTDFKNILLTVIEQEQENYRQKSDITSRWRQPLLAAASARDDYFTELKEAVSPNHLLPEDLLAGAETVICYFLPFAADIPASNTGAGRPSRKWARAYRETNSLIGRINKKLQQKIEQLGGRASFAAATGNFSREELVSRWSHKHAAYIAGLGTFGRHHMLITESGCGGRIGSLVTDMVLSADHRPEEEYCLDKAGQDCQECVDSCEFSALTTTGLDRETCYQVLLDNTSYFNAEDLEVCGKCAVDLPCTLTNPREE